MQNDVYAEFDSRRLFSNSSIGEGSSSAQLTYQRAMCTNEHVTSSLKGIVVKYANYINVRWILESYGARKLKTIHIHHCGFFNERGWCIIFNKVSEWDTIVIKSWLFSHILKHVWKGSPCAFFADKSKLPHTAVCVHDVNVQQRYLLYRTVDLSDNQWYFLESFMAFWNIWHDTDVDLNAFGLIIQQGKMHGNT